MSHPAHPPRPPKKKNGIAKALKNLFLLLFGGAVLFIGLDQMGVPVTTTTENTQIIDRPRAREGNWEDFERRKKAELAEKRQRDHHAGQHLRAFISDYRKTGGRDLQGADLEFLKKMDDKAQTSNDLLRDAQRYYNYMDKGLKVYRQIKNISQFAPESPVTDASGVSPAEANRLIGKIYQVAPEKVRILDEDNPDELIREMRTWD